MSRFRRLILVSFISALVISPFLPSSATAARRLANFQPLGYWADICVLARQGTDETLTLASDDTWADYQCGYIPANSGNSFYPISQDPALRPGSIQCAFIQRYTGEWQPIIAVNGDYQAAEGAGQTQMAIRADYDTALAARDCGSLWQWTDEQNTANGFLASTSGGGGIGGGGACTNCGGGAGAPLAPPKAHKAQKPMHQVKAIRIQRSGAGLRSVDWFNRAYPWLCDPTSPGTVRVHNGSATIGAFHFALFAPIFGDLTGDGQPEAVVPYGCTGADYFGTRVLVYSGTAAHPILIGRLPVSAGPADVRSEVIAHGILQLSGRGYSPTAAHCCPDLHIVTSYRWNGKSFVVVKNVVTHV